MKQEYRDYLEKHCGCMHCGKMTIVDTSTNVITHEVRKNVPFCTKYGCDCDMDTHALCRMIEKKNDLLDNVAYMLKNLSIFATSADYVKGKVNNQVHDFIHHVRHQSDEYQRRIKDELG